MNVDKLKSCPFCGSDEAVSRQEYSPIPMFFVGCDNCGASASYCDTQGEAVEAWNERVDKSQKVLGKIFEYLAVEEITLPVILLKEMLEAVWGLDEVPEGE